MKAIIPVAGVGTKLRPLTYSQPKALIPVAGKPIISYIIDQLLAVNVEEFVFIVGYLGDKIEAHVKQKYPNIKADFVEQSSREGIGHAIWQSKEFVNNNEPLIIVLGDTIIDFDLKEVIKSPYSSLGVKKVDDPRAFGVAEINDEDTITKVEEKPKIPKSNMALVGVYLIQESEKLFAALDYIISNDIKTRDEYQLTDAIMEMINQGIGFKAFKVSAWHDCGQKDVLLEINADILKQAVGQKHPDFKNTIIVEPVSIGENCQISNAIVGPNVSIGENTKITHSIVQNSIIGSYSAIVDALLHDSVIGSDAYIKGISQSLNLGDNTEIDFS